MVPNSGFWGVYWRVVGGLGRLLGLRFRVGSAGIECSFSQVSA